MKSKTNLLTFVGALMICASVAQSIAQSRAQAADLTDPIDNSKHFVTRPVLLADMVAPCGIPNTPSDTTQTALRVRDEVARRLVDGYSLAALIPLKGVITDGSFKNGFVGIADESCAYIFVRQPGVK